MYDFHNLVIFTPETGLTQCGHAQHRPWYTEGPGSQIATLTLKIFWKTLRCFYIPTHPRVTLRIFDRNPKYFTPEKDTQR